MRREPFHHVELYRSDRALYCKQSTTVILSPLAVVAAAAAAAMEQGTYAGIRKPLLLLGALLLWCTGGLIALDVARLWPTVLSLPVEAMSGVVQWSTISGLAASAPLAHCVVGKRAHQRYQVWQPLCGGWRFSSMQAAGWSLYSAAASIVATSGCLVCEPGILITLALIAFAGNSIVLASVFVFDGEHCRANKPTLASALPPAVVSLLPSGSRGSTPGDGACPLGGAGGAERARRKSARRSAPFITAALLILAAATLTTARAALPAASSASTARSSAARRGRRGELGAFRDRALPSQSVRGGILSHGVRSLLAARDVHNVEQPVSVAQWRLWQPARLIWRLAWRPLQLACGLPLRIWHIVARQFGRCGRSRPVSPSPSLESPAPPSKEAACATDRGSGKRASGRGRPAWQSQAGRSQAAEAFVRFTASTAPLSQGLVLDTTYPTLSIETLRQIAFHELPHGAPTASASARNKHTSARYASSFLAHFAQRARRSQMQIGPWLSDERIGRSSDRAELRIISYRAPKSALVRAHGVTEYQRLIVSRARGSAHEASVVVDVCVDTPEVPYGATFRTRLRYVLAPSPGVAGGVSLRISWELEWGDGAPTGMQAAMVRNGARGGLRRHFQQFEEALGAHVQEHVAAVVRDG